MDQIEFVYSDSNLLPNIRTTNFEVHNCNLELSTIEIMSVQSLNVITRAQEIANSLDAIGWSSEPATSGWRVNWVDLGASWADVEAL